MADKILVTGAAGLLGADLVEYLKDNYNVIPARRTDFDITDKAGSLELILSKRPGIVIHCAAMADVNACQKNSELAMAVNADGAKNIALACREIGCRMIHISTDYVFNGEKEVPYIEDDPPGPVNIYGESKLAGERYVSEILPDAVILRVAWLYGLSGDSFVKRLIARGRDYLSLKENGQNPEPIRMVDDQIGTPTRTDEIARQIEIILLKKMVGLFHCTAAGGCSRYELARLVFSIINLDIEVVPCKRQDFPDQAPRPRYSILENARLKKDDLDIMRDYGTTLIEFIKSL